jgi:hypothetical protein
LRRACFPKTTIPKSSLADVMAWGDINGDKQKQTKQNKPFSLKYI